MGVPTQQEDGRLYLPDGGRVCRPRRADVAQDRFKHIDDDLDDDDAASPWSHLFAEKSDYTLLRKVPLWLCLGSDLGARIDSFRFRWIWTVTCGRFVGGQIA